MQRAALSPLMLSPLLTTAANDDVAGRALHRRIEIVVAPDLSGLPGTEALERLESEVAR